METPLSSSSSFSLEFSDSKYSKEPLQPFVVVFVPVLSHLSLYEFHAVCSTFHIPVRVDHFQPQFPYCILHLPPNSISFLCSRLICVSGIAKLLCHAASIPQILSTLNTSIQLKTIIQKRSYHAKSLKISFKNFQCKTKFSSSLELITALLGGQSKLFPKIPSCFNFLSSLSINLRNPDLEISFLCHRIGLWNGLIARVDPLDTLVPGKKRTSIQSEKQNQEQLSAIRDKKSRDPLTLELFDKPPDQIFLVYDMQETHRKSILGQYRLTSRKILGTTSMPPTFVFLMANLCGIKEGDIVYDPFHGTGSCLVGAAHFKALVFGSEMDSRIFEEKKSARPKKFNCLLDYPNLAPYSLGVFLSDNSSPMLSKKAKLGAILCDPPYGIRETCTRLMKSSDDPKGRHSRICVAFRGHSPHKQYFKGYPYPFEELLGDLLSLAKRQLVVGSRIAFWYPIPVAKQWKSRFDDQITPDMKNVPTPFADKLLLDIYHIPTRIRVNHIISTFDLPTNLEIVYCLEDPMNSVVQRYLFVIEKVSI